MKATAVAFVAFALAAGACGGGGGGGDAGDNVPTRESQCRQIMTPVCNRAGGECQQFPPAGIPACISSGVTACCAGNCGAHVVSTQADIDACSSALEAATCASLDVQNGGALPTICVGVVRSALTPAETAAFGASEGNSEVIGRLLSR